MTHHHIAILVATSISVVTAIAMSWLAVYLALKPKDDKKAFYAKDQDFGRF